MIIPSDIPVTVYKAALDTHVGLWMTQIHTSKLLRISP